MIGRPRPTAAALAAILLGAGALAPAPALAHGIAGRADLPIPVWLFGWAAAAVLVISFAALGALWSRPRLESVRGRPLMRVPAWIDPLCGALGVAAFAIVVYCGLAGSSGATANLLPTFVYVHFWVGLAVLSVLFGDVFRLFNPWRALARGAAWAGRRLGAGLPEPPPYPAWLGRWPAVAGIAGFAWLELAYADRDVPGTLALIAIGYAVVQLGAMSIWGIERWCARGDAFGVLFGLYARLSPFRRREGVLELRPPLSGAPALDLVPGTVTLLCVAIGTTTYDGLENGPLWLDTAPHLQSFFAGLGAGSTSALELTATAGLAACVLVVTGFYRLGIAGMRSVGGEHDDRELAGRFAHSLIPIAFAYALAHYFSLLVFQGQSIVALASDPLGRGSDLFGTAGTQIDYGVISAAGIWYVQVAALVCGHVAGLTLAHDRALVLYRAGRRAARSQHWMLLVMVGFTSLGLWLLSAVNAQ